MGVTAIQPISSTVAVCGLHSSPKIIKTTDGGFSWSTVFTSGDLKYTTVRSLARSSSTGTLIAGTSHNQSWILRSTDDGDTWAEVQQLTTEVAINDIICLSNGRFIAALGDADADLWLSDDDGATWTLIKDLGETSARCLLDCGSGVVLCGTGNTKDLFRSINYGSTWGTAYSAGVGTYIMGMIKDSVTDNIIIGYGSPPTIGVSLNDGVTVSTGQALGTTGYIMAFCQVGTEIFAVTRDECTLWKTTDGGINWTQVMTGLPASGMIYEIESLGSNLLIGGEPVDVPLISTNGGDTWTHSKIHSEDRIVAYPYNEVTKRNGCLLDLPLHDEYVYHQTDRLYGSLPVATDITFAASDLSFPALDGTFKSNFRPAYFNGTTSHVYFGNAVGAVAEDTSYPYFVLSFWFRPDAIPTTEQKIVNIPVYSTYSGIDATYISDGGTGASIRCQARSYNETMKTSTYTFTSSPVDTWVHVAFSVKYNTASLGYIRLYIDGELVDEQTSLNFTYNYFNYTATPSHKESIGASHNGTAVTEFYQGHLALMTLHYSNEESLTSVYPAARYNAICNGFRDVHSHNLKSTMFSANNLRI